MIHPKLYIALVISCISITIQAATLTIYPNADATIPGTSNIGDDGFGANPDIPGLDIYFQASDSKAYVDQRSFMNFDLSILPKGAVITGATLYLYGADITIVNVPHGLHYSNLISSSYEENACYIQRITSSWNESTVTVCPATTTTNRVSLANSTSNLQNYTANVLNLINDIYANPSASFGLMLLHQNLSVTNIKQMCFASSDFPDATKHPKIVIEYTDPAPQFFSTYTITPTKTKNYVHKITPLTAVTDVSVSGSRSITAISENITYLDGFGRVIQSVDAHASPLGCDVVQPVQYDKAGRMPRQYLNYTADDVQTAGGNYQPLAITNIDDVGVNCPLEMFYSSFSSDPKPFAENVFDGSPLNRVIEQGAPGSEFQPGSTHTNQMVSKPLNTNFRIWEIASGNSATLTTNYYGYDDILKLPIQTLTTDADNNQVMEYHNRSGQLIAKEVPGTPALQTIYVYDKFHQLRYIITPEAAALNPTSLTPNLDIVKKYCFYYQYDALGRKVLEQKPGADSVLMVYDRRNRPVLSQDGNQRLQSPKQWSFVKYDALDRPVITGIFTSNSSRKVLQDSCNLVANALYEDRNVSTLGYTNNSYPKKGIRKYLTINYYDTYTGLPAGYEYSIAGITGFSNAVFTGFSTTATVRNRGKATWGKTAMLDSLTGFNTWLVSAVYYDDNGRVIQAIGDNLANGKDRVSNKYNDFTGQLLATVQEQLSNKFTATPIKIGQRFTYDHRGRLLKQYHQIYQTAANPEMLVKEMVYNELGQGIQNKVYAKVGTTDVLLQCTDYEFNIRGWLKSINGGTALDATQNDLFGMAFYYTESLPTLPDESPHYNGNISAVNWKHKGSTNTEYSAYVYDNRNQLIKSNYALSDALTTAKYDVFGNGTGSTLQYDKNGNILNMKRNDGTGVLLDNFAYRYTGNQLIELAKDGVTDNVTHYTYDKNGNMTADSPGNNSTAYNLFNLPKQVTQGSDYLKFGYSAIGAKLFTENKTGATISRTYYLGNIQYTGDGTGASATLDFITTSFGRMVKLANGTLQYEYFITDNLGNIRVRYRDNGSGVATVLEKTDYYAFGLVSNFSKTEGSNQYQYSGKELHEGKGIKWYDYGARYYDPVIGRWHSVDPMTQHASPYIGIGNNPVNLIDRWGMCSSHGDETPCPSGGRGGGGTSGNYDGGPVDYDAFSGFYQGAHVGFGEFADFTRESMDTKTRILDYNRKQPNKPQHGGTMIYNRQTDGKLIGLYSDDGTLMGISDKESFAYFSNLGEIITSLNPISNEEYMESGLLLAYEPSGQGGWDSNGDGKLQKNEADNYWLHGGGVGIAVDNSKIDWTGLKIPASAKVGKIFSINTTQAFLKLPYETAATYGGTSFILRGAHTVEVVDQLYHYQYRPNNSAENVMRNFMNWYGKPDGQGTDFMIHYNNPLTIIK